MSNLINLTSKLQKLSQELVAAEHAEREAKEKYDNMVDHEDDYTEDELDAAYEAWVDASDIVYEINGEIADIEQEIEELTSDSNHDDWDSDW